MIAVVDLFVVSVWMLLMGVLAYIWAMQDIRYGNPGRVTDAVALVAILSICASLALGGVAKARITEIPSLNHCLAPGILDPNYAPDHL